MDQKAGQEARLSNLDTVLLRQHVLGRWPAYLGQSASLRTPDDNYSRSQTPSKHLSLTAGLTPTRQFWAAELCSQRQTGLF